MSFQPIFNITALVVRGLEAIATLKAQLASATLQVTWVLQLQKDSTHRGAHASMPLRAIH